MMAIWAVIHFSIMPVKSQLGVLAVFEILSALLSFMVFL